MMDFFLKAATQILMVLLYIAIGFILRRSKMLPETTSKTLSVMETLVFLPALLFNNLSTNVKIEKITTYSKTILCGAVFLVFEHAIAVYLPDIAIGTKIGMFESQPNTIVTEVIGAVTYLGHELNSIHQILATSTVNRLIIGW